MMRIVIGLYSLLIWTLVVSVVQAQSADTPKQPNILYLLVDDLAWSDLGCYGHPWHQTPNIDRLAASGMRLTNGYAPAPICSASRASIQTGKTTARLGFEFVTKDAAGSQQIDLPTRLTAPPFQLNLPLAERTIAERLGDLGYETAFFGKWHLNQHHNGYLGWSPTHGPRQQGYQVAVEDFGAHPYAWKKKRPKSIDVDGQFAADTLVQQVCDYVSQPHDQPFFALASSFYVHTPVKTPCQWLTRQYDATIPASVKNRDRRVTYAAFLQTLDHHIGQILDALDASGQRDQTLVVFQSDNGGHPEFTGNGPLRGSKWNLYEGGIRVPLIASWSGKILAGSTSDAPVIGYDLLPTFVELAGGAAEDVDGQSVAALLTGSAAPGDRELLWHFPYYHPETGYSKAAGSIGVDDFVVSRTRPQSAIRSGHYKLLWFAEDDRVELYDLRSDIAEQHDLTTTLPQIADQLKQRLLGNLKRVGARMAVASETSHLAPPSPHLHTNN
ncbi:sulfatase [Stieleria sp. TO1_6]|uniref:sulfatase n=1 Tax=Stieleria tagensis TaxID=2956795 RepID=UPI00209B5051|nr:sulfatase [Stieleria tagensis]MCO8124001.1 sulfatase [Stieleria tagensis]